MNTKKTNLIKQIMLIFLSVFMLQTFRLPAREITVSGTHAKGNTLAELQEINHIDKLIQQGFRLKKHHPDEKRLMVEFHPNKGTQLLMFRHSMRLFLSDQADLRKDPAVFRAVVCALILSRGCKKLPADAARIIPEWICAGLREKRRAAEAEERFIRGMRNLPAVSAMYVKNWMPDMVKFTTLAVPGTPELLHWYDQFARLLLETAADNKMLANYVRKLSEAKDPRKYNDHFTGEVLAVFNQSNLRTGDNPKLNQTLWNTSTPEPAARKLARWDEAMKWEMPEVDKNGKLTDKVRKCTIPELPLLLPDRPDAKEQLNKASHALREYARGCNFNEAEQLQRLLLLLNNQSADKEAVTRKVEQITNRIKELFQFRQRVETLLIQNEIRFIGVQEAFPLGLQVYASGSSASPEQEAFLRKTETIYGD